MEQTSGATEQTSEVTEKVSGATEQTSFKRGLLVRYRRLDAQHDPHNSLFPTWSWASRKSSDKFASAIFMNPSGIPVLDCSVSSIYTSHKSGERIDIAEFAQTSQNYKDYLPLVQIIGWSIWIPCNEFDPIDSLYTSGENDLEVRHNFYFDQINGPQSITLAIFLIAYKEDDRATMLYFLLLEPAQAGKFRRVGIWRLTTAFLRARTSVDALFSAQPKFHFVDPHEKWEVRDVCIV